MLKQATFTSPFAATFEPLSTTMDSPDYHRASKLAIVRSFFGFWPAIGLPLATMWSWLFNTRWRVNDLIEMPASRVPVLMSCEHGPSKTTSSTKMAMAPRWSFLLALRRLARASWSASIATARIVVSQGDLIHPTRLGGVFCPDEACRADRAKPIAQGDRLDGQVAERVGAERARPFRFDFFGQRLWPPVAF